MSAISLSPSTEYLIQETAVTVCKGALKAFALRFCGEGIDQMAKTSCGNGATAIVAISLGILGAGLGISLLKDGLKTVKNTSILGYRAMQENNLSRTLAIATIAGGSFLLGRITKN